MPETAAGLPAESDSTDLTTMERGGGLSVVLDEAAQERLRRGAAGRLGAGARLIFRAVLTPGAVAGGETRVAIDSFDAGQLGFLAPADARRYRAVLGELRRTGRHGVCAGYLQRAADGTLEARLLLDEPYECLRRIETDVLERAAPRERSA